MMMLMIDNYNDGDDGDDGDDVPVMLMMQCNQIFFPSPPCSCTQYIETLGNCISPASNHFFLYFLGTIFQYLLVLVAHLFDGGGSQVKIRGNNKGP